MAEHRVRCLAQALVQALVQVLVLALVLLLAAARAEDAVRVEVATGVNASCPWFVAVDGGGNNKLTVCAEQLSLSFQGQMLVNGSPEVERISYENVTGNVSSPLPAASSACQVDNSDNGPPLPFPAFHIPRGYFQLDAGFYKVHEKELTWRLARAACEAEGAHLVVVDSKEEAAALKAELNPHNETTYTLHAGFFVDFHSGTGQSLSTLGYERWAPGQPAAAVCGRIDSDAWLLLGSCSERRKFVCELGLVAPQAAKQRGSGGVDQGSPVGRRTGMIPSGYSLAPGRNDSYYTKRKIQLRGEYIISYGLASKRCREEGAKLGLIESEDEAEALKDLLQTFSDETSAVNIKEYVQRNLFYLDLHSREVVTVLGNPLSSVGYFRWVMKPVLDICVCADSKMLYYTCSSSQDVEFQLCEYSLT